MHSVYQRDGYKGYLALGCAYLQRVVEEVQRAANLRNTYCAQVENVVGIRPGVAVEKIGCI
jgi:hypothetical protein